MPRVLVVDDHAFIRRGVMMLPLPNPAMVFLTLGGTETSPGLCLWVDRRRYRSRCAEALGRALEGLTLQSALDFLVRVKGSVEIVGLPDGVRDKLRSGAVETDRNTRFELT